MTHLFFRRNGYTEFCGDLFCQKIFNFATIAKKMCEQFFAFQAGTSVLKLKKSLFASLSPFAMSWSSTSASRKSASRKFSTAPSLVRSCPQPCSRFLGKATHQPSSWMSSISTVVFDVSASSAVIMVKGSHKTTQKSNKRLGLVGLSARKNLENNDACILFCKYDSQIPNSQAITLTAPLEKAHGLMRGMNRVFSLCFQQKIIENQ